MCVGGGGSSVIMNITMVLVLKTYINNCWCVHIGCSRGRDGCHMVVHHTPHVGGGGLFSVRIHLNHQIVRIPRIQGILGGEGNCESHKSFKSLESKGFRGVGREGKKFVNPSNPSNPSNPRDLGGEGEGGL